MTEEVPQKICPECQSSLAPDAPEGLCPSCLLKQVVNPLETRASRGKGAQPPSVETLTRAFPELDIHELIGQGGMGTVFRATQKRMNRLVALKVLPERTGKNPEFAERFAREAQALARLNHPAIVTLHDFGEREGIFYLLMEYVDGVNLREAMQAARFTPHQALKVVPRLCDALEYAHQQGVLHRDIKPANILLNTKGEVKLVDFGIAKLGGLDGPDFTLTHTGGTLGTPHYMAPEQIEQPRDVDHRADIYSLGVVLYELLTGELPIGRFAPPSKKSEVGAGLDSVVLKALEKEREARQQSAREMRSEVETATSLAVQSTATDEVAPPRPPTSLSPFYFWSIGLLLTGLILSLGYDILKLISGYHELMKHLSIDTDGRFFGRVAFEGAMVLGICQFVWLKRRLLLDPFPLRHPRLPLSLYPVALAALVLATIPMARTLAITVGGIYSFGLILGLGVLLGLAAIRLAVPSSLGYRANPSSHLAGKTFLWLSCLLPCLVQLMALQDMNTHSARTASTRPGDLLGPESLSLGWSLYFFYLGPVGLALVGQSRIWRKMAILGSSMLLCSAFYGVYQFLDITYRILAVQSMDRGIPLRFWLSQLVQIIALISALAILLKRRSLVHFGLEPRRSGFLPEIRLAVVLTPKSLLRALILMMGIGVIATGGLAYLFEIGGETLAKNKVDSYEMEFLNEEVQALQTQIENTDEELITVLAVTSDRLGDIWWTPDGRIRSRPPEIGEATETVVPEVHSKTCHLLIRLAESIGEPRSMEISFGENQSILPLVQYVDERHRLLTFSEPGTASGIINGFIAVTPSKSIHLAQAKTLGERQLSTELKFHWDQDSAEAQQVAAWLNGMEEWSFEMWGHSMLKSLSTYTDKIRVEEDQIIAAYPQEIGPFSNFNLFVRPRFRMRIESIALVPKEN